MKMLQWMLVLVAVVGLAAVVLAGDEAQTVTVTGKIVCAKCTLHKAEAKECQSVLVADEKGATTEYYIEKNDVAEKFGHVCKGEKGAVITGTVSQKDGKTWIAATKIEEPKG